MYDTRTIYEISRLESEVERLREALRKIATCDSHHPDDIVAIARKALNPN